MSLGWVDPSAGGVSSVNGDIGPAVVLGAADVGAVDITGDTMQGDLLGGLNDTSGWGTVSAKHVLASSTAFASTQTPASTSNPPGSAVTYLSLGSGGSPIVLDTGSYLFLTSFFVSVSASNTQYYVDIQINGAPSTIGASVEPLGVAGAQANRAASIVLPVGTLLPNSLWFDLVFAKNAGTGSVTIGAADIILVRIA